MTKFASKKHVMIIHDYLKNRKGMAWEATHIFNYVNRKTNSTDRYYQILAALVGETLTGGVPAKSKWTKEMGLFKSVKRIRQNGKSYYQWQSSQQNVA